MMRIRFLGIGLAPLVAGCGGVQSMMGGQGAESANFVQLFIAFLAVCALMYLLVIAAVLASLRRRHSRALTVENRTHHQLSGQARPAAIAWIALIFVGLTALTIASFLVDRSNASVTPTGQMSLTVTANQWWWDVEYSTPTASHGFHTANEIHLPVGVPVLVKLKSNDVIHSLWIPNLAGKQDLIPGRDIDLHLMPRETGRFRAQCAEFCGLQHSKMALDVAVESKAEFLNWYAAQLKPAAPPTSAARMAGYNYVMTRECSACHSIVGTPASGQVAPDLTHFASRRAIAAGSLPMDRASIEGWIADPQHYKRGNRMPTIPMSATDRTAVVAYLEGLK
jgi:cytochrome c oxidase subunit II